MLGDFSAKSMAYLSQSSAGKEMGDPWIPLMTGITVNTHAYTHMTFKGMYPVLLAQDLIPLTVGLSMSVFSVQVYSVAHRCAADNGCSP